MSKIEKEVSGLVSGLSQAGETKLAIKMLLIMRQIKVSNK